MFYINHMTLILLGTLSLGISTVNAEDVHGDNIDLQLSSGVMELLRAEMRELLVGVQSLPAGIATADWEKVAETGAQINASYILARKLTPEQRKELGTSLPAHFKRMDAQFHLEAKKLEAAARNHDAQLSSFHYYRMLESCTACHTAYAPSRFPGFLPLGKQPHGH
ncbi:hypothetical protein [Sulfuriflexus sp.]|uniref:hypothetical protein n=1 Tax=Sulfuriflexus sp. TaxID=2015443 RepID=UPI0028CF1967|nr:hypothetical protein [Sulfuriflexus sp.]MDT8403324.1 hypothetical protein [Sulfuriflexus sp.]